MDPVDRRTFLRHTGTAAALAVGGMSLVPSSRAASAGPSERSPHVRRYQRLGRTEMKISEISLGSNRLDSADPVRRAFDLGINYFDTAESYDRGRSERLIGEALKGKRDKVYITTKALTRPNTPRAVLTKALEGSLRRLKTDYVDVFMCHAVNTTGRLSSEEWQEFVALAKKQGKRG